MLPVVAFPFKDFYIDSHHITHELEPQEQQILFYTGLLAAALGIGGIRAILCPMGAYSLQCYNQHQLLSFFNWWVVLVSEYSHWPAWLIHYVSIICSYSQLQATESLQLTYTVCYLSVGGSWKKSTQA